ncbi:MAG: DNA polymerase III subunit epsilon [Rickettsiaceae bacterium]
MREIILDTETTGLDPKIGHRIIEIGALEMRNKVLTGKQFHYYINPERDVPNEAYRIHGISSQFLQDKPLFSSISEEFLEFIEDSVLVIHNAAFDLKFLNSELNNIGFDPIDSMVEDTLIMARKIFPGMRVNLDALCKKFKIDNSSRTYHGALKDAALLAEVYVELTGGRQVKFDIDTGNDDRNNKVFSIPTKLHKKGYHVIKPNAAELKAHEELLSKINNPLWLKL